MFVHNVHIPKHSLLVNFLTIHAHTTPPPLYTIHYPQGRQFVPPHPPAALPAVGPPHAAAAQTGGHGECSCACVFASKYDCGLLLYRLCQYADRTVFIYAHGISLWVLRYKYRLPVATLVQLSIMYYTLTISHNNRCWTASLSAVPSTCSPSPPPSAPRW